jgi:hypothetical protein
MVLLNSLEFLIEPADPIQGTTIDNEAEACMQGPIKIAVLGISVDLGLFAHVPRFDRLSVSLAVFLMRITPRLILWLLGFGIIKMAIWKSSKTRREAIRSMSHRLFSFLLSSDNIYEHDEGYGAMIGKKYGRSYRLDNHSKIGHSLRIAYKQRESIREGVDIYFVHLGSMDWLNLVELKDVRRYFRGILEEIGRKNPQSHVCILGLPDMVNMITHPETLNKIMPLPFFPSVSKLQEWEGFHKYLGLNRRNDKAQIQWAERYMQTYANLMQHELRRAIEKKVICSGSFVDNRKPEGFNTPDRQNFLAIDGMHPTTMGALELVKHGWKTLERDLDLSNFELRLSPALSVQDSTSPYQRSANYPQLVHDTSMES